MTYPPDQRPAVDWRRHASCLGQPASQWFPHPADCYIRPQQQTCADCPVAAECAQDAIDADDRYGIRAGVLLSSRHKRDLLRLAAVAAGAPVQVTAPLPPAPQPPPRRPPRVKAPTPPPRLSDDDVRAVRAYRAAGTRARVLARLYGVSPAYISAICLGRRRADAGGWITEPLLEVVT